MGIQHASILGYVTLPNMKVLGRVRLSRSNDESTSVERQREMIQQWADVNEHEVIGWAEDIDVSGSMDPWQTPGLGPWLADDRLVEWDIIVAWKLDRFSRRAVNTHRLFALCEQHSKILVCIADSIDLSTWVGRLVASVIAGVAEGELEAIRERQLSSQSKLRAVGRHSGGVVPYGYRKVTHHSGSGYSYQIDETAAAVIRRAVEKVLTGESVSQIARELNDAGELTPSDYCSVRDGRERAVGKWNQAKLRQLLGSPMLMGIPSHDRVSVRNEQGDVIPIGPPILDTDTWHRLQETKGKPRNKSVAVSPLNGIVLCKECGSNLHRNKTSTPSGVYYHYRCPNRCGRSIRSELLETLVEELITDELADKEVTERVFIPGTSASEELKEAERALEELTPMLATARSERLKRSLMDQLDAIDSKILELEKQEDTSPRYEYRSTGEKYLDVWNNADAEGRRRILLSSGIQLKVLNREGLRWDAIVPPMV